MSRVGARLAPDALAPARARSYAARQCERFPAEALQDVLLLTTELVNNAIWHGAGDAWLDIEVDTRSVTVGVTDSGGGDVKTLPVFSWPERGHGLRLVEAVSDRWGVEPASDEAGKRVWFELIWNPDGA